VAPSKREARRAAEALFARAGDALTAGVQVVTGQRPRPEPATTAPAEPAAPAEPPRPAASGEEAAARLDAARERLRANIAPPADEELEPPPR
jgi:hypothetical protein